MAEGAILFGLMAAGGIGGAISGNSAGKVSSACNGWQGAINNYNTYACKWRNILSTEAANIFAAKEISQNLKSQTSNYSERLLQMKDAFKQQELATVISISILIFVILISFLLKYFNVYGMVWDFFVNKK